MNNNPDSNAAIAHELIDRLRAVSLATGLAGSGWPFASLVLTAPDHSGMPLLLISSLAEHTRNIAADNRVSLLYDGTNDYTERLTGPRLTLLGRAIACTEPDAKEVFLAAHPSASTYADFQDFSFYRIAPERGHLVAGFGRIEWISWDQIIKSTLPKG